MVYSIIFTENVKPEWVCPTLTREQCCGG